MNEPIVGSYNIFFKDTNVTPSSSYNQNTRVSTYTIEHLSTGKNFSTEYGKYVQKNSDCFQLFRNSPRQDILLITNEVEFRQRSLDFPNAVHYTISDIDFIKVLVHYDEVSKVSTFEDFSFDEVIALKDKLYESK